MNITNVIGFADDVIDFDCVGLLFSIKQDTAWKISIVVGINSASDFTTKIQTPIKEMPKPTAKSIEKWIFENPRYLIWAVMEAT